MRRQVNDDDVGETQVGWQIPEEELQGLDTAR
jgi:hypothetical protein